MNAAMPSPDADSEEVSALIDTLHETSRRLEELTRGEVDTVASRDGHTILLRHAQDQLRRSVIARIARQAGQSPFAARVIRGLCDTPPTRCFAGQIPCVELPIIFLE